MRNIQKPIMKIQLIILLFLNFGVVCSQEKNNTENDSIIWTKATCESGTQQAEIDFENGKYVCYSYGLIFQTESPEFIEFLNDYRKKKYGIITGNAGCVVTDYTKCYSKKMTKLVLKKFGPKIFKKSKKEAEKLFAKKN